MQGEGCVAHERRSLAVHRDVSGSQDGCVHNWLYRRRTGNGSGRRRWRSTRHQGAVVDFPPRVGNGHERFRPVLCHDDADARVAGEGVEHGDDVSACCGVKVGQGLVHQEQGRLLHHGGGNGYERCLTGREGADVPVQQRRYPDTLRDLQHPGLGGPGCRAAQLKREADFVPDPGAGEGGAGILQYDADEAGGIARRCGGAVRSGDPHRAGNFSAVNV